MTRWVWMILLGITFSGIPLAEKSSRRYLVIWNIGQGQWVTAINETICFHFDMGGEFFRGKGCGLFADKRRIRSALVTGTVII